MPLPVTKKASPTLTAPSWSRSNQMTWYTSRCEAEPIRNVAFSPLRARGTETPPKLLMDRLTENPVAGHEVLASEETLNVPLPRTMYAGVNWMGAVGSGRRVVKKP